MKYVLIALSCFFSAFASAEEFKLELMLGEIEKVLITTTKPNTGKNVLDHSCAGEEVTFNVSEYLTGSGANKRIFSRTLASYNCGSSWDGMPVSPSIAMISVWPKFSIYRGIVCLTKTTEGYQVVDSIPDLLRVLAIHNQKNPEEFLVKLKEPIIRHQGSDQGTDELKSLAKLGIIEYQEIDIDLNENCISGCEKGNIIKAFEVLYIKGIPLSKLRGKTF